MLLCIWCLYTHKNVLRMIPTTDQTLVLKHKKMLYSQNLFIYMLHTFQNRCKGITGYLKNSSGFPRGIYNL